ncbi:uncharacterized protein LOC112575120 [Pomacea canaliculata]|uniref:uncharacterized protein LOC112575120 n=1 Tax=Pomacea canaliculata TaxID=400727 RepID=UPI000D739FB1|nr:uncharacterized protein LOC112575120 [Pomacea canaliculata]
MISEYRAVHPYSERGVSDQTDGPPVKQLYHRGQGHSGDWPGDCMTCGREVASFLHSLRDDALAQILTTSTLEGTTTPPKLQWRDMLVLCWAQARVDMGMITGLQEAGIPVQVMTDDDIEEVATARSDVVWVADTNVVRGLERKVVVCVELDPTFSILSSPARLHSMSRCTSQLVIVSPAD